jgi:hypothetical protein
MASQVAMHRQMDCVVFDYFVNKKGRDIKVLLNEIKFLLFKNKGVFNERFFNEKYCNEYALCLFSKFLKNQHKSIGFKKFSSNEESVLMFFVNRKSNKCFLPQQLIASGLGVTQKTVSLLLSKMVSEGKLNLISRGSSFTKKASLYELSGSALDFYNSKVCPVIKPVVQKIVETGFKMKNIFSEKSSQFAPNSRYVDYKNKIEAATDDRPFAGSGDEEDDNMDVRKNTIKVMESLGFDMSKERQDISFCFKPDPTIEIPF